MGHAGPMRPAWRRFVRSLSRVVLAAFLTLSSGIALTAQAPQKSTAPRPSYRSAPGPDTPLGLAWQQFLTADLGGTWWSRWSPATGTPREIWGSGIALSDWRGDNQLEARRQAQMFLNEHKELLALGTSEFREQIGARMGETWVFVYQQYFRGIPAVGGRADVRVHAVGRVPMFGSTAWQIPADFLVIPQLDELEATRLAWTSLGVTATNAKQPGKPRAPRLVIWGDLLARERQTPRLCWEIPISNIDANGDGLLGRSYVDAASGAVLHYESDKHECGFTHSHADEHETEGSLAAMPQGQGQGQGQNPGKPSQSSSLIASYTSTGRVMAQTRAGLAADSALVTIPVAGARVTTGLYSTTTDAGGYYSITWLGFGTSISAAFMLDGQHSNPMSGTNSPATSRTLVPGLNPDVTLTAPSDLEAAHTSTYYWIYEVNEWARSILGNSAELNTADSVAPKIGRAHV